MAIKPLRTVQNGDVTTYFDADSGAEVDKAQVMRGQDGQAYSQVQVMNAAPSTASTPTSTQTTSSSPASSNTGGTGLGLTGKDQQALINQQFQSYVNPKLPTAGTVKYTGQQISQAELINPLTGQVDPTSVSANTATVAQQAAVRPENVDAATYNTSQVNADAIRNAQAVAAQDTFTDDELLTGQLKKVLTIPEGEQFPAWAQSSARRTQQMLAARGIDNSSMAGTAIMTALVESAVPIAQANAAALQGIKLQNLSNRQQAEITNTQLRTQALFTNASFENAALQFNATSQNQTNTFMANLATETNKFNANMATSINQYNAGQTNAMAQFNATMKDSRERFNAQNSLVIEQANTKWRQQINTANNQGWNEASRVNALNALSISNDAWGKLWQRLNDDLDNAFQASQNAADRDLKLYEIATNAQFNVQNMQDRALAREEERQSKLASAAGGFASNLFSSISTGNIMSSGSSSDISWNSPRVGVV